MNRILSLVLTFVFGILFTVYLVAYFSSEQYSNEIELIVQYSPETTWQELVRFEQMPNRKNDVESIEVLEEFGKLVAWRENLKNGGYRVYRTNKRIEKEYLEIELTESSYGLTGIWTFALNSYDSDTKIIIKEESVLTNKLLRGYRIIFSRTHDLLVWQKYIRVGLVQTLLITP